MNTTTPADQTTAPTMPDLRKGALTKNGTLLAYIKDGTDDGEVWSVRDHACIERPMTIYPEDVTGQTSRLWV